MPSAIPTPRGRWPALRLTVASAVMLVCGVLCRPAMAGYVIQPGDTLELSVTGLPALNIKAMVDVDGTVRLPLVAPIQAAGLTLDQVTDTLRQTLPQKAVRQVQPDGRDSFASIEASEISLEISEYRPVYIRGDVDKPGEIRFRPGLSVRQAIALAGGYDTMHFHMENPFLQSSDLRAENQTLWIQYARSRAHALLLDAEIRGVGAPDLLAELKVPLPAALISNVVTLEKQRRSVQLEDYTKELDYMRRSAASAQTQLAALIKPRDEAAKSEADDAAYKKSLTDLLQKGVISHDRITDQQRSLLESTQRFLDYTQRIEELGKTRADFERQAERLQNQHHADLLKELQDANTETASVEGRLQAVDEKLVYTGMVRSQLVRGDGQNPEISIVHAQGSAAPDTATASEDTILAPGDTVEVSLKAMRSPSAKIN